MIYPVTRSLFVWLCLFPLRLASGIEGFEENFDGVGDYSTVDDMFNGMDLPGWMITTNVGDATTDSGWRISEPGEGFDVSTFERTVLGNGSFVHRIELLNFSLETIPFASHPDSIGLVRLFHYLNPEHAPGDVAGNVGFQLSRKEVDSFLLFRPPFQSSDSLRVPIGQNIAVELRYDAQTMMVSHGYDSDIFDDVPIVYFEEAFAGPMVAERTETWVTAGEAYAGDIAGTLHRWSLTPFSSVIGDFSGNGVLDSDDVQLLIDGFVAAEPSFDLNSDTMVDFADLEFWVHDLKNTYFGDANLDGEFASSDLVFVFGVGEYEDDVIGNSTWATGDWNADGEFSTSDLVLAFQDGGYEQGPRAAVVPEPSAVLLGIMAVVGLLHRRGSR